MDDEWYISEDGNLVLNDRKLAKICILKNGRKFKQIYCTLENGLDITLSLGKFRKDHYQQIDGRCKESRTIFSNWIQQTFPHVTLVNTFLKHQSENSIESCSQKSDNVENDNLDQRKQDESESFDHLNEIYALTHDCDMVENNNEGTEEAINNDVENGSERTQESQDNDVENCSERTQESQDNDVENGNNSERTQESQGNDVENGNNSERTQESQDNDVENGNNSDRTQEIVNNEVENGRNSDRTQETLNNEGENGSADVRTQENEINDDEDDGKQTKLEQASFEKEQCQEQENTKQKCIGKSLLIPIGNLIQPRKNHCIRDIDLSHVKALESQFIKSKEIFTVLVGNTQSDVSLTGLQQPGNPVIEVIGGNHTRLSLQNITKKGYTDITHVRMDVYKNLTDVQALMIGMLHNIQHEHSKPTTFVDKVKVFRNLYLKSKQRFPESERKSAIHWRTQVSLVVGLTKDKVKNQLKAHLSCASLPAQIWDAFEDFISKWEEQKIQGQPKTTLKQTHLLKWVKLSDPEMKENLLRSMCRGDISFSDMKECSKDDQKKEDTANKSNKMQNENKGSKSVSEDVPEKVMEEKEKQRSANNQEYKRQANNAEKRVKELEKKLELKEKEVELARESMKEAVRTWKTENRNLKRKFEEMERQAAKASEENKGLTKHICELQSEMKNLTQSLEYAEEAAARARSKVKEESNQKGETRKPEEKQTVTQIKKRKINCSETNKDIVIVEYNRNTIYMGQIVENNLIYCKKPIGQIINNEFVISSNHQSFQLNTKDRQSFDKKYLIIKMEGLIADNKINVDSLNKNEEDRLSAINHYIQSRLSK